METRLRLGIEGPIKVPRPAPHADLAVGLCTQQLREVRHLNERAGRLLGFEPPVIETVLIDRPDSEAMGAGETTITLVAAAVAPLAAGDPVRYAGLAGLVALIVGVMLCAAGLLRLGVVARLLTRPVLLGYQGTSTPS